MATQALILPRTADAGKNIFLLRFFPSLGDVAFLMPLVILFTIMQGTATLLGDGDPGWHLRTGQWILQNHRVPQTDMFSFTHSGKPWFAWEWLWDVTFGWVHQTAGMGAVLVISMAVIALTMGLVFRQASRMCGNPLLAVVLVLLTCGSASIHFLARPHLFTMLLTAIFMILLEARRNQGSSIHWIFPILMLVWVNLHGGFVAGLLLMGGYASGAVLRALFRGDGLVNAVRKNRGILLTSLLCFAATFVNPYTYHLHQHVISFLTDDYAYLHISEFQPLNFHNPLSRFFEPLALLGAVSIAWSLVRRRFDHAILLALWLHLALMSSRNVPLFAIVATPLIARSFRDWVYLIGRHNFASRVARMARAFRSFGREVSTFERVERFHLTSIAALALIASVFYAPNPPEYFRPEYSSAHFPVKAAEHLGDPGKRVLSIDTWGGYLIYAQYPTRKVFVDGRSDFYGDDFEIICADLLAAKPGWQKVLAKYRFDRILLPPDFALVSTLRLVKNWTLVYEDKTAVVFEPAPPSGTAGEKSSAALSAQESDVTATSAVADEVVTIPNHKEKEGA